MAAQTELPTPFAPEGWPVETREAAHALWAWHRALQQAQVPDEGAQTLAAFFAAEQERAASGAVLRVVPHDVSEAAYRACSRHRLSRALLAEQVGAAGLLQGSIRFATAADQTAFIQQWTGAHGRLLAALADARGAWQQPYVDELARAFFIVGRLVRLPQDLAKDQLFLPLTDLEQAGVEPDALWQGKVDEPMRKLLWKQSIRARDAFAQGLPLVNELAPRFARALKRWWLGGLEVLNEIQRRGYDVWTSPVTLSRYHRFQVRLQARFGRATFRGR